LFGHSEFISNVIIPSFAPTTLITGGGDDHLFSWNWIEGKLIDKFPLKDVISKYLTDAHLTPSKFQNEEQNLQEFCVSQIISVNSTNSIAVLIEQTSALLILKLDSYSKLSLDSVIELTHPIISVASSADKLIVSIENDDDLLRVIDVNTKVVSNLESSSEISKNSKVEISSKDELFPLYTISQLRKRGEH
jgi:tRNA (guanine-N(7)-)-methyltransferase subunit TRM82